MKIAITLMILFVTVSCFSGSLNTSGKYQRYDCITPIDSSYSWYGEVAIVKAFSTIEGFSGRLYILSFPWYQSESVIFDSEIESATVSVPYGRCSSLSR